MRYDEKPTLKFLSPVGLQLINTTVCKESGQEVGVRKNANLDLILNQANSRLLSAFQDLHRQRMEESSSEQTKHQVAEFGASLFNPMTETHRRRIWADAASALIFNIVKVTPFVSCNCGTAAVAARTWLYMNKCGLATTPEEALEAVIRVYENAYSGGDMTNFIYERIRIES